MTARLVRSAIRSLLLVFIVWLLPLQTVWAQARLFVVDRAGTQVHVLDTATNALLGSIAVGMGPATPARNRAGTRLFVPNRNSNNVSVIDTDSMSVVATLTHSSFSQPVAVAPTPNGRELWVLNRTGGNSGQGSISIVDLSTESVIQVVTHPDFSQPEHLAINPGGSRTYVVNTGNNTLTVLITFTRQFLLTVNVGDDPRFAVVTANGQDVYVANQGDGTLSRVRTQNHTVIPIGVGGAPRSMTLLGNNLHVALGTARVLILNVANNVSLDVNLTGGSISTFSVAPVEGANLAFVSDSTQNRLLGFNPVTQLQITEGFPVTGLGEPRDLVSIGTLDVADLELGKTVSDAEILNGFDFNYSLTVENLGPSPATNVRLEDTLPTGVTFVSSSSAEGECMHSDGEVVCRLDRLEPAASALFNLTVRAREEGIVTNEASVDADQDDPNPDNNTADVDIVVDPAADLAVEGTPVPNPVAVGQLLSVEVRVRNLRGSLAENIRFSANLPESTTFVSAGGSGANCSPTGTGVICNLESLFAEQEFPLSVRLVPQQLGEIRITLLAQSTVFDPDQSNNSISVRATVEGTVSTSDVRIVKEAEPPVVPRRGSAGFLLQIENLGPDPVPAVTLLDTLPPGLQLEDLIVESGAICDVAGAEISCALGAISVGETRSVRIGALLTDTARGSIVNTARVIGFGIDPDTDNNESSAEILVFGSADFNRNGVVDAADLQFLIFEINDGDGNAAADSRGGTFPGSPSMDLNADGLIDQSDVDILIRLIFARP